MTNNDYATHYTKEKGGNWYQFPAYVKIDKKDLLSSNLATKHGYCTQRFRYE